MHWRTVVIFTFAGLRSTKDQNAWFRGLQMILGPNDPFRLFRIVIEVGGTLLQSCPYLKVKTVTVSKKEEEEKWITGFLWQTYSLTITLSIISYYKLKPGHHSQRGHHTFQVHQTHKGHQAHQGHLDRKNAKNPKNVGIVQLDGLSMVLWVSVSDHLYFTTQISEKYSAAIY